MSTTKLPYDKTSRESIVKYAEQLLGKTLRKVLGGHIQQQYTGKGRLGQLIEKLYFQYEPNSESAPDFPEAGLELKSSPLKKTRNGLRSKERLVLNIIDYLQEHTKSFEESSFWKKNACLLLMFYLHEDGVPDIDLVFEIIRQWDFPPADLKIIKDDWAKIVEKIKTSRAHEISEGDTLYLGACTKGNKTTPLRQQFGTSQRAKQRAFSLKSKYLNFIIEDSLGKVKRPDEVEAVVKDVSRYAAQETFEELVIKMFRSYYGKTADEIAGAFGIKSISKSMLYMLAKAILGVKGKKIEEFEKADVEMKTICLEKSGTLKESMSFAQIKYQEIIKEDWETSYWHDVLVKRFFFVVFQKDDKKALRLKKVMFWGMPVKDQAIAEEFWLDTKKKIQKDDFKHFIKISDDRICHVRPKGRDSSDLMKTASGRMEKKMCYWLNSSYIKNIVTEDEGPVSSLAHEGGKSDLFFSDVISNEKITPALKKTHVPICTLEAVATTFREQAKPEVMGWKPYNGKKKVQDGMFIARVVGRSMETTIMDGSWCLFRPDQGGTRNNKVVLVESRHINDPETSKSYTIKRYFSDKVAGEDENSFRHTRIILKPDNKDFDDIVLPEGTEEGEFHVVAEWVENINDHQ